MGRLRFRIHEDSGLNFEYLAILLRRIGVLAMGARMFRALNDMEPLQLQAQLRGLPQLWISKFLPQTAAPPATDEDSTVQLPLADDLRPGRRWLLTLLLSSSSTDPYLVPLPSHPRPEDSSVFFRRVCRQPSTRYLSDRLGIPALEV